MRTETLHDLVMLVGSLVHWPDQMNTYVPTQSGVPLSLTPRIEGPQLNMTGLARGATISQRPRCSGGRGNAGF